MCPSLFSSRYSRYAQDQVDCLEPSDCRNNPTTRSFFLTIYNKLLQFVNELFNQVSQSKMRKGGTGTHEIYNRWNLSIPNDIGQKREIKGNCGQSPVFAFLCGATDMYACVCARDVHTDSSSSCWMSVTLHSLSEIIIRNATRSINSAVSSRAKNRCLHPHIYRLPPSYWPVLNYHRTHIKRNTKKSRL